jgi:uncharacterized protein (TIGR02145 family)
MKMKSKLFIYPLVIIGALFTLTNSCKKDNTNDDSNNTTPIGQVPVLTTLTVSDITQYTCKCGGNISSDAGLTVTARGVCWSTGQTPTITDNKTTDGVGAGSFTSNLSGLSANTTYYLRAYATNASGTGYGSTMSFVTQQGNYTVTDVDGNVYHTIVIGTQVWMVENLKTTKYRDGTSIHNVTDNTAWISFNTDAYCDYNNDASYSDIYGRLYNEYAVFSNIHNICPIGWHVPSDAEWTTLTSFLGGESVAGGKLKEAGTTHWISPNTDATNESGFTALPGSYRDGMYGNTYGIGEEGRWWTSTPYLNGTNEIWYRILSNNYGYVFRGHTNMAQPSGLSVRCIRD